MWLSSICKNNCANAKPKVPPWRFFYENIFIYRCWDETYHYPTFIKDDHDNLREACKNPSCAKQKLKAIKCCHQIQNLNRKLQEDNKQIENELTFTYTENEKLAENLNKIFRDKQISDTEYQELNLKYNSFEKVT